MIQYSEELINECIKCFTEENNHKIDKETAVIYLNSLAGLCLILNGKTLK